MVFIFFLLFFIVDHCYFVNLHMDLHTEEYYGIYSILEKKTLKIKYIFQSSSVISSSSIRVYFTLVALLSEKKDLIAYFKTIHCL